MDSKFFKIIKDIMCRYNKIIIFIIYMMYCIHYYKYQIDFRMVGDDAIESELAKTESFIDMFMRRYNYNGRICTDVLANVFYRVPIEIWMLVITFVWFSVAWLIINTYTKGSILDVFVVCILIVQFPYHYMGSAGYIATSTNYLFSLYSLLVIAYLVKQRFNNGRLGIAQWIIMLFNMIYASNHDQSGIAVIIGLLAFVIFLYVNKEKIEYDNKMIRFIVINLILAIGLFVVMFMLPGHIYRMTNDDEMLYWLPEYVDWNFGYKIFKGYSSTVAVVLYNNLTITNIFCFLLLLFGLTNKSKVLKIVASMPFVIIFVLSKVGHSGITTYYTPYYMYDLYDLDVKVWPFVVSILIILFVIIGIANSCLKIEHKWCVLVLLIIGAVTREMMGFSPTIYASSYRTFTILIFALLISAVILYMEIKNCIIIKSIISNLINVVKKICINIANNSVVLKLIKEKQFNSEIEFNKKIMLELIILFVFIIVLFIVIINSVIRIYNMFLLK